MIRTFVVVLEKENERKGCVYSTTYILVKENTKTNCKQVVPLAFHKESGTGKAVLLYYPPLPLDIVL